MLRNADVFVKPRHDLVSKSAVGGFITLIAGSAAAVLFVAQLYLYITGVTQHSLHLSASTSIPMYPDLSTDPFVSRMFDIKGKIPLKIHITFPHLKCEQLEVKLDNAPLGRKDFDPKSNRMKRLEKRRPNPVELMKALGDAQHSGGCTIRTMLRIPIVAGQLTITLTREAWTEAAQALIMRAQMGENEKELDNSFNVSHYIHSIQFGTPFPLAAAEPLEDRAHTIHNTMGGIALESIQVKLVPTVYTKLFSSQQTYQLSVVDHTVQPETLVAHGVPLLPGLSLGYDITPLAVYHVEGRDNILVFLSSLVSIVGGVFVTVGLFAGCMVHSAQAVAKKVD